MPETILNVRDKTKYRDNFIEGVKACLPTIFGYLSIGFAAESCRKSGRS
ncbi:hypothetical protein APP_18200 [Aeribacillus pallidus]|nr:hypothetical protein APP_18200 [Aeribacillus pallidus]